MTSARQTPLYAAHVAAGARMVDFAGWLMPVQYTGILDEHRTVRSRVGMFDVSHMGEARFRGARALEVVQDVITNDASRLADRQALYTVVCRPEGGIVDDCIVYRFAGDDFLIIINASNIQKDVNWFRERARGRCEIIDESEETALLAVQGPRARELLAAIAVLPAIESLHQVPSFGFATGEIAQKQVVMARTGYTGEDGFELLCAARDASAIWNALRGAGEPFGLQPCGLGARDTLRLEAKLCLYGNDIDETTTPLEAGLGWVVQMDKGDFCGREALLRQKAEGLKRRLVGFVMRERGIARHGYPILGAAGARIGLVTSGTTGPTVGVAIGMGYVEPAYAKTGTRIVVDCRGKPAGAEIVSGPFYRKSEQPKS